MNKKFLFGAAIAFAGFASCTDDNELLTKYPLQRDDVSAVDKTIIGSESGVVSYIDNACTAVDAAFKGYKECRTKHLTEGDNREALDKAREELMSTLGNLDNVLARNLYKVPDYKLITDIHSGDSVMTPEILTILSLLDTYNDASETLINLKRELASETSYLAKAGTDIVDIRESINDRISALESKNAEFLIGINVQNNIIKYAGTTVVKDTVDKAYLKMVELRDLAAKKQDAYTEAALKLNEAYENLARYYNKLFNNRLWSDGFIYYSALNKEQLLDKDTVVWDHYNVSVRYVQPVQKYDDPVKNVPDSVRGKYCLAITGKKGWDNNGWDYYEATKYIPFFGGIERESNDIDYEISSGKQQYSYGTYKAYFELIDNNNALDKLIEYKQNELSDWSNSDLLEKMSRDIPALEDTEKVAQERSDIADNKYKDAFKAYVEAKQEYETAKENAEERGKDYYTNKDSNKDDDLLKIAQEARRKRDEAYSVYRNAEYEMTAALNEKQNARYDLEKATVSRNVAKNGNEEVIVKINEDLKKLESERSSLSELRNEYKGYIAAYNDAAEAKAKAYVAYLEAQDASEVQYAVYRTKYDAYWQGIVKVNDAADRKISNANEKIKLLEDQIEANQIYIKDCKEDLDYIEYVYENEPDETRKRIITEFRNKIINEADAKGIKELLERRITTAQQKYDTAKTELEAALEAK